MEIWKDIEGYEGYYQISSMGNVKNVKTNKLLLGDVNRVGYKRVILYSPVKKRFFVHRLVAYHFVDGYQDELVVNHKDGNKTNNCADNLEWVTRSENDIHAFKLGLRDIYPCVFKRRIIKYDLLTNEILHIYNNTQECCDDLNVERPNVYNCCNSKQRSCKGFGLRYE